MRVCFYSFRALKYSPCLQETEIKAILIQYFIPFWMVSRTTASLLHYIHLLAVLMIYHLSGSDGVFDINSTSGCITVTTYPSLLRKELYEIKVKVKSNVLNSTIYLSSLPI